MVKAKNKKKKPFYRELIDLILIIGFLFVIFRPLVWEPFIVPSESMLPAIEVGDQISVSKSSYGWSKYSPVLFSYPFVPKGRLQIVGKEPERGDIVVFKNFKAEPGKQTMIKRLIGMPGDTIALKNNIVYINGKALEREKIAGDFYQSVFIGEGKEVKIPSQRYYEILPNGRKYIVYQIKDNFNPYANLSERVIEDGHYFFMGDNRDRSKDSRAYGTIEESYILGKANIIITSNPQKLLTWPPNIKWPFSFRLDRSFRSLYKTGDYDQYYPKHK